MEETPYVPQFLVLSSYGGDTLMLTPLRTAVVRFLRDEDGASLVEYALLIALIAVVCVGAVTAIGSAVNNKLTSASTALGTTP
jgi:pilus assembly protein Flp/PilA